MLVKRPFLKLPIRFDGEALAAEVRALPPSAWSPHPTGFVGNEAVRLISPGGAPTDAFEGPMAPTENLARCDYVREIMAELGGVWGRSRFMGLAAGAQVPPHVDTHYYWRTHLRLHIPVITNPGVSFTCGDETVRMAPGECWAFDSFQWHNVQNKGSEQRIHLVLDTVGGGRLPELLKAAEAGTAEPQLLRPGERSGDNLAFEKVNSPAVMSPWEMRCHLAFVREHSDADEPIERVFDRTERFIDAWAAAWARFGPDEQGRPTYMQLLHEVTSDLAPAAAQNLQIKNRMPLLRMLHELIFQTALGRSSIQVA